MERSASIEFINPTRFDKEITDFSKLGGMDQPKHIACI
jgi:hypothetical protein